MCGHRLTAPSRCPLRPCKPIFMEIAKIIPHVEALIFSSDHPLPAMEIVELLNNAQGFLEDRATMEQVEAAIEAIIEKYQSEFYAFEIRQSGGGYQFLTKPAYYPTVAQLNGDKYLKKLSTAALETLAIIAYRQPVTKGDIESIRGVNSDYSIQKLLEKELIIISGRNEEMPGKPLLYNTSRSFMDYFGLNSPEDLPKIKEIIGDELVDPTKAVSDGGGGDNDDESSVEAAGPHLEVSETGELRLNSVEPVQEAASEDESAGGEAQEATLYIDEVVDEQGEEPLAASNGDPLGLLGDEQDMDAGEAGLDINPAAYPEDEGDAREDDEASAFTGIKDPEGKEDGDEDDAGEEDDDEDAEGEAEDEDADIGEDEALEDGDDDIADDAEEDDDLDEGDDADDDADEEDDLDEDDDIEEDGSDDDLDEDEDDDRSVPR